MTQIEACQLLEFIQRAGIGQVLANLYAQKREDVVEELLRASGSILSQQTLSSLPGLDALRVTANVCMYLRSQIHQSLPQPSEV
jgi:hypothetical protein